MSELCLAAVREGPEEGEQVRTAIPKKPYNAPRLTGLGSVRELTMQACVTEWPDCAP